MTFLTMAVRRKNAELATASSEAKPSKKSFVPRSSFWVGLGIVIWLAVVISHIPSHWAAFTISKAAPVSLSGLTGTFWSGRASLVSFRVDQTELSLGQLTWSLEYLSLLQLKPCARITTSMDNQTFEGRVCVQKNKLFIENATASLPTRLIQPFLPLPLDGQVSLNIDSWQMADNKLQKLHAKVAWMNAKVFNGSNWMSFGTMAADLVDDGKNGLSAHLFDVNSPLHLDAVINLVYPAGGTVKGGMSVPEGFVKESNATAWLSMFATQQGQPENGQLNYSFDVNL